MDERNCGDAEWDLDHHSVCIKHRQEISNYKNTHGTRQRQYDVKKLKDTEIMRICKEEIRKIVSNKIIRMRKKVKLSGIILRNGD